MIMSWKGRGSGGWRSKEGEASILFCFLTGSGFGFFGHLMRGAGSCKSF